MSTQPLTFGAENIGINTIQAQAFSSETVGFNTIGANTQGFGGGTSGGGGAGGDFGTRDGSGADVDSGGGGGGSGGGGADFGGASTVEIQGAGVSWTGSGIAGLHGGQQALGRAIEAIYQKVKCLDLTPESPTSPNPESAPVDLTKLETAVGVDEFPVSVPLSFYGNSSESTTLENLPEMITWLSRQMDALFGQFPAEIEQTNQAGETELVSLKNVAEGLVELYGLSAQIALNSDYAARGIISVAAETVAAKNAALITQDYVVANSDHLGYRGNPKVRKVNYSVNPTADNPADFLQPFEGEVIGWEYEDKGTIKEDLIALRHSGGIIKAAFSRGANQLVELGLEAIINEFKEKEDGWDEFIRDMRDPRNSRNINNVPPRIVDRSQGDAA